MKMPQLACPGLRLTGVVTRHAHAAGLALALLAAACSPQSPSVPKALNAIDDQLDKLDPRLPNDPSLCGTYEAACTAARKLCGSDAAFSANQASCSKLAQRCAGALGRYCGARADASMDARSDARTDAAQTATCGNSRCESGETCESCAGDCGPCVPETKVFVAKEDSYVDEGAATENFGSAATLLVDQAPTQETLLRFTVSGVRGSLTKATLRLYVENPSAQGPRLHLTNDPWTESSVTWNNRPAPIEPPLAELGYVAQGWIDLDVTAAVARNGPVAFVLVPASSDGADLCSREGTNEPELVVESTGGASAATEAGNGLRDAGPHTNEGGARDGQGKTGDGGAAQVGFTFFAVGDTRSQPAVAQQNFASMVALDPSAIAVFNTGDITLDGNASQWADHIGAIEKGGQGKIRTDLQGWDPASIRYLGAVGNHDVHVADWLAQWNTHLPGQRVLGHNGADGVWYAVTYQNALFVVLDSTQSISAQTTWLDQTLTQYASTKWKFLFWHYPVYPCSYKSPWDAGVAWVRVAEKHKVDMVFNGHAHVYDRSCPMIGGRCANGGVTFVTTGGGGASTGAVEPTKQDSAGGDSYNCSEVQAKGFSNWFHYCHLRVGTDTLNYNCYSHDSTSAPRDTLTITK